MNPPQFGFSKQRQRSFTIFFAERGRVVDVIGMCCLVLGILLLLLLLLLLFDEGVIRFAQSKHRLVIVDKKKIKKEKKVGEREKERTKESRGLLDHNIIMSYSHSLLFVQTIPSLATYLPVDPREKWVETVTNLPIPPAVHSPSRSTAPL